LVPLDRIEDKALCDSNTIKLFRSELEKENLKNAEVERLFNTQLEKEIKLNQDLLESQNTEKFLLNTLNESKTEKENVKKENEKLQKKMKKLEKEKHEIKIENEILMQQILQEKCQNENENVNLKKQIQDFKAKLFDVTDRLGKRVDLSLLLQKYQDQIYFYKQKSEMLEYEFEKAIQVIVSNHLQKELEKLLQIETKEKNKNQIMSEEKNYENAFQTESTQPSTDGEISKIECNSYNDKKIVNQKENLETKSKIELSLEKIKKKKRKKKNKKLNEPNLEKIQLDENNSLIQSKSTLQDEKENLIEKIIENEGNSYENENTTQCTISPILQSTHIFTFFENKHKEFLDWIHNTTKYSKKEIENNLNDISEAITNFKSSDPVWENESLYVFVGMKQHCSWSLNTITQTEPEIGEYFLQNNVDKENNWWTQDGKNLYRKTLNNLHKKCLAFLSNHLNEYIEPKEKERYMKFNDFCRRQVPLNFVARRHCEYEKLTFRLMTGKLYISKVLLESLENIIKLSNNEL
jgi:hypothetical protein